MSRINVLNSYGNVNAIVLSSEISMQEQVKIPGFVSGSLRPRSLSAWVLCDDKGKPDVFLNIPPEDTILDSFRGRWLLVKKKVDIFDILGRDISRRDELYLHDSLNGHNIPVSCLPQGQYISCSKDKKIDISTGHVVQDKYLNDYDLVDMVPLVPGNSCGTLSEPSNGSPVISNSPINSNSFQKRDYVYILRGQKTWKVLIGPISGTRLKCHSTFEGTYWCAYGSWIVRNGKADNIMEPEKSFSLSETIESSGMTFRLKSVYFLNPSLLGLIYESANFQLFLTKTVS